MADGVQLGGLRFLDVGEVPLRIASISNPGGTSPRHKGADQLLDPSSRGKWFDSNFTRAAHSVLLITLMANDPFPAQFELITANDASKRDPSDWQVSTALARRSLRLQPPELRRLRAASASLRAGRGALWLRGLGERGRVATTDRAARALDLLRSLPAPPTASVYELRRWRGLVAAQDSENKWG